jgi:hypothetical protein
MAGFSHKKKKSRFQKNKSRKIDKIQQNLIRKTTEIATVNTVSRILNHGGTDKCKLCVPAMPAAIDPESLSQQHELSYPRRTFM